jgi:myo-inositol-1(or 4)-monophosphatase
MRILLAGPSNAGGAVYCEVGKYRSAGHNVMVNTFTLDKATAESLWKYYKDEVCVDFCEFPPALAEFLILEITRGKLGYDAIIYPPDLEGFTSDVVAAAVDSSLASPLKVVGCPNDFIGHLSAVKAHGVHLANTPDVHQRAVAEYTICQMAFHARMLGEFYKVTGENGAWPHDMALCRSHSFAGKTLGVIGATGKDGSSVALLARRMGLRVLGIATASIESQQKISGMGILPAGSLDDLLQASDFISINSTKSKTLSLLGKSEFARMKKGVIIVNPAGAEIIDKQALFDECSKAEAERKVATIILDMPYGGRRGDRTFSFDPDNARLRSLGVIFTPRVAGYTADTYCLAVDKLADTINHAISPVRVIGAADALDADQLAQDLLSLVKEAGAMAKALRKTGLDVETKADGSPTTNADRRVEESIRDGLRAKGHVFTFTGEELGAEQLTESNVEIITDGIDGTRNFRDDNYGWCTSVCVMNYGQPVIGVVHDPKCGDSWWAIRGKGAFVSDGITNHHLRVPDKHPADFSFSIGSFRRENSKIIKDQIIDDIKKLGGRQREWGSVALSICGTARGGLGAFVQGNAAFHDYAAALLIAREAGARTLCVPCIPAGREDVIVAHPNLFEQIQSIVVQRSPRQQGSAQELESAPPPS